MWFSIPFPRILRGREPTVAGGSSASASSEVVAGYVRLEAWERVVRDVARTEYVDVGIADALAAEETAPLYYPTTRQDALFKDASPSGMRARICRREAP